MQANAKRNYLTYVHAIIMFVIMFGVGTLPTFGQVTPLGMKILGVFLGKVSIDYFDTLRFLLTFKLYFPDNLKNTLI